MNIERELTRNLAMAILLIEGYVSVSLQMIALRQLVPFVGSNTIITSLVITGFLAALATGYWRGGLVTMNHGARLQRNLVAVALVAGVGLSYVTAGFFFEYTLKAIPHLLAVALYVAVILAPIVYLLAETVVILINYTRGDHASEQAGNALNLSTWGNVVGGLLTTLVIMYFLGVGWSITIDSVLLLIAYMLIPSGRIEYKTVLAVVIVGLVFVLNVAFEHSTFLRTTPFANYRTVDMADGSLVLDINDSSASRNNDHHEGHQYIEYFEDRAFKGRDALHPKSVLVLGAGGFTFGRGRDLSETTIKFVDVDSALNSIGADFLGIDAPDFDLTVSDARAYLLAVESTYDLIVLDTFSHGTSIPAHLLTLEYFQLVRSRLAENGTVLVNIIMPKDEILRFQRGFDNTIRAAFAGCSTKQLSRPFIPVVAELYECRSSVVDDYHIIYRDRDTRAAIDSARF
ncbi:MAG: hypothetical protein GY927_07800 [bacterium]|nr:hypothetical protein [bacterium]